MISIDQDPLPWFSSLDIHPNSVCKICVHIPIRSSSISNQINWSISLFDIYIWLNLLMPWNTYTWRKIWEANFTFFGSGAFQFGPCHCHRFIEGIYNMCLAKECLLIAIVVFFHEFFLVPFKVVQKDAQRSGWYLCKIKKKNTNMTIN